ncbi:MAG: hypothetical protein B7Y37_13670 [Sphingobacteriia bacterium 28-36-52]|nr:MAG: hypothetical protein B7Y37_13670 [Sphingobacteriia bacterium 28-36-52]
MEKKQTAVQWLIENAKGFHNAESSKVMQEQALSMFREQIEEAYKEGGDWEELPQPRFNNYYTQTFKP